MAGSAPRIPKRRTPRTQIAARTRYPREGARRDTSAGDAWTKAGIILPVVAAALTLRTAAFQALSTSPPPPVVVVIHESAVPASGAGETHPDGTSGPGGHQADDRNRACAGKSSPWPRPRQRAAAEARRLHLGNL
jgi:hypothetical protein